MTGRMWVRTVDRDAVAVDQIVQYTPEEGAATGRTVLTVHTASDWRHYLGPFVSERAALDFALRHLGPVVDPAGLSVEDKQRDASRSDEVSPTADRAKHDPPSAAELLGHLDDLKRLNDDLDVAIARQRAAQREAGLRLDAPETACDRHRAVRCRRDPRCADHWARAMPPSPQPQPTNQGEQS